MPLPDAVAEAREVVEGPTPQAAGVAEPTARHGLTRRELEVLRLLVERRTDKEIAAALVVSPRTVMTHVASILDKLGVASRREVAAAASRLDLA
jgi:DNA-binding NarL/FixJ family response regulator